ncbi:MAG: glutaredoxin 3 [Proteobacteria bacterium]|nr:glutaredoxin 3 [Pseudomonadota bacterium]
MPRVTLYGSDKCSFCLRAEHLLRHKGVVPEKIDIAVDARHRDEMMRRSGGRRSMPQIFIGSVHVGGFDELAELDRRGLLDSLLSTA